MRVFCGGIATETNTFSPIPTALEDFAITWPGQARGDFAFPQDVIDHLRAEGDDVVEGLSAFAQPAGVTVRAAYETMVGDLLTQLQQAGSVDAVMLVLHGAMVVDGIDDAEVDIVQRVRAVVGAAVKIGVELDLHCHIDDRLLGVADVVVIYKEYPHVDVAERGIELAEILRQAVAGRVTPVMALFDCKMVGLCSTVREPMKSFVADMQAAEGEPRVLSLSLAHGFPYGDVAHAGAKMLAITDGDNALAVQLAEQWGRRFYDLRHIVLMVGDDLDTALQNAVASTQRPTIVADQADNAGGGAPADSTFALRWLVDHGVEKAGVAIMYDPEVVKIARAAGRGARLAVRLGGKTGPVSGDPVDLAVEVIDLIDNYMHEFPQAQGSAALPIALGNTACLKTAGIYVMVASRRSQCFSPKIWTDFGISPAELDIIVVKSTNHFMSGYAGIAGEVIYMSSAGALPGDVRVIDYRNMPRDKYPWLEAPLG